MMSSLISTTQVSFSVTTTAVVVDVVSGGGGVVASVASDGFPPTDAYPTWT